MSIVTIIINHYCCVSCNTVPKFELAISRKVLYHSCLYPRHAQPTFRGFAYVSAYLEHPFHGFLTQLYCCLIYVSSVTSRLPSSSCWF